MGRTSACSVGWFVSLLVREEVLLAGLCEKKNTVPAGNLRSFTTSHSQTNKPQLNIRASRWTNFISSPSKQIELIGKLIFQPNL